MKLAIYISLFLSLTFAGICHAETFTCSNNDKITCNQSLKKVQYSANGQVLCKCIAKDKQVTVVIDEDNGKEYPITIPDDSVCIGGWSTLQDHSSVPYHILDPLLCHQETQLLNKKPEDYKDTCINLRVYDSEKCGGYCGEEISDDYDSCPRFQMQANIDYLTKWDATLKKDILKETTNKACVVKNETEFIAAIKNASGTSYNSTKWSSWYDYEDDDGDMNDGSHYIDFYYVKPALWAFEHTCTVGVDEFDKSGDPVAKYRFNKDGKIEKLSYNSDKKEWGSGSVSTYSNNTWKKDKWIEDSTGWCADPAKHCVINKRIELQNNITLTEPLAIGEQKNASWPFVIEITSKGNKSLSGKIANDGCTGGGCENAVDHQLVFSKDINIKDLDISGKALPILPDLAGIVIKKSPSKADFNTPSPTFTATPFLGAKKTTQTLLSKQPDATCVEDYGVEKPCYKLIATYSENACSNVEDKDKEKCGSMIAAYYDNDKKKKGMNYFCSEDNKGKACQEYTKAYKKTEKILNDLCSDASLSEPCKAMNSSALYIPNWAGIYINNQFQFAACDNDTSFGWSINSQGKWYGVKSPLSADIFKCSSVAKLETSVINPAPGYSYWHSSVIIPASILESATEYKIVFNWVGRNHISYGNSNGEMKQSVIMVAASITSPLLCTGDTVKIKDGTNYKCVTITECTQKNGVATTDHMCKICAADETSKNGACIKTSIINDCTANDRVWDDINNTCGVCKTGLKDINGECVDTVTGKSECEKKAATHGKWTYNSTNNTCAFSCNSGFKKISTGVCQIKCTGNGMIPNAGQTACACDTANHWMQNTAGCKCEAGYEVSGGICSQVGPIDPTECSADTDCDDDEICTDGECHTKEPQPFKGECKSTGDCGEGMICSPSNICVCDTDNDWNINDTKDGCTYNEQGALESICELNGGTYFDSRCIYNKTEVACLKSEGKWETDVCWHDLDGDGTWTPDTDLPENNTNKSGCGCTMGNASLPDSLGTILPYLIVMGIALSLRRKPNNH